MKKKLAIKLAALMFAVTNITTDMMRAPNSLLLWGEPNLPMEKEDK